MSRQRSGLIVAISEPMIDPDKLTANLQFDLFEHLPHYALNRLVVSLAPQARQAGITLLGLLPGFMKTERVQVHMQAQRDAYPAPPYRTGTPQLPAARSAPFCACSLEAEALQKLYRYDLAESTEYTGRAVAALACDPNLIAKSGQLIFVGDAAKEYGFTDIDGSYIENFYRAAGRF